MSSSDILMILYLFAPFLLTELEYEPNFELIKHKIVSSLFDMLTKPAQMSRISSYLVWFSALIAKRVVGIMQQETNELEYIAPEESSLQHHLQISDSDFIDFLKCLLEINPKRRPTAREALQHPWLTHSYN